MTAIRSSLNAGIRTLRFDEAIGFVFTGFTVVAAVLANIQMPPMDMDGVAARILISLALSMFFLFALLRSRVGGTFGLIRDFAPFLFVLLIYFNIQDTIRFIHPSDFHHDLVRLDALLFGVQPTVWMEQFYHPRLTDWFSLSYFYYYLSTPVLLILLYRRQAAIPFRKVVVVMMTAYYIGFAGYLFFPSASPYLVIPELFKANLWQGTWLPSWAVYHIVELSPERARDAFPSMHNAIVLLTLIMAWRYHRGFFWASLPLAVSLPFATLYLRYHFLVDIIAALPVVLMAFMLGPWLEKKWTDRQHQGLVSATIGETDHEK